MYKSVFAGLTVLVMLTSSAYAEDSKDLSIREAMIISALLMKTAQENGLEVVRLEMDIVHQGAPMISYRRLQAGWTYVITVAGQATRVEDTDLRVYRKTEAGELELVAKDTKVDPVASVVIKPEISGIYIMEISVYKFKYGYDVSAYSLMVAH